MKKLYTNNLLYYALFGVIVMFVLSFIFPFLYGVSWIALAIVLAFSVLDILILFGAKTGIEATRITPEKLSNGDENPIHITIKNYYTFRIKAVIIDEIPFQFQVRNFKIIRSIKPNSPDEIVYYLRPTERGEYYFGALNV